MSEFIRQADEAAAADLAVMIVVRNGEVAVYGHHPAGRPVTAIRFRDWLRVGQFWEHLQRSLAVADEATQQPRPRA